MASTTFRPPPRSRLRATLGGCERTLECKVDIRTKTSSIILTLEGSSLVFFLFLFYFSLTVILWSVWLYSSVPGSDYLMTCIFFPSAQSVLINSPSQQACRILHPDHADTVHNFWATVCLFAEFPCSNPPATPFFCTVQVCDVQNWPPSQWKLLCRPNVNWANFRLILIMVACIDKTV